MLRKQGVLIWICALCLAVALGFGVITRILAAPGAPFAAFSIPWWTVDSGGGGSQGGPYGINGGIGQPDATVSSGGNYTLSGGFWSQSMEMRLYLPLIRK